MKSSTILFMLELERYIEHEYSDLRHCTNSVSDKFKYFMTYLGQNCVMNKFAVNILRKIYDRNCIECELIAYASDHIVCHALYEK